MKNQKATLEKRPGRLAGHVIVLGVTGSIAAYKAAELTRLFGKEGGEVHVIMTEAALKLVGEQTFRTLSRNAVVTSLWESPQWQPEHIALAERADLLVVAPATANILAKMAHGIADDALSTYCLSHSGKTVVAPAMNPRMWNHPATRDNCKLLEKRGVFFAGPAAGEVACGEEGRGRMLEPAEILQQVLSLAAAKMPSTKKRIAKR